jgi:hypothetical protein
LELEDWGGVVNIVRHKEYLAYTGKERIHCNLMHIKFVRFYARYVVEYGRLTTFREEFYDWWYSNFFRIKPLKIYKKAVSNPPCVIQAIEGPVV